MQFFSFPLLTPTYVKLKKKKPFSFKPLSLPGCCPTGGVGLGDAGGGGDGFCVGGSLDDGGGGDLDGLIGCSVCMVLYGQSRLAEVHL